MIPWSVLALVLANIVPIVGVLFLEWDVATILVLYWVENGVVGVKTILDLRFHIREHERAAGPDSSPYDWMRT